MSLASMSHMQLLAMLTVVMFGHVLGVLCYKLAAFCCLQLCQLVPVYMYLCDSTCLFSMDSQTRRRCSLGNLGTEQPVQQPAFSPNLPVSDKI